MACLSDHLYASFTHRPAFLTKFLHVAEYDCLSRNGALMREQSDVWKCNVEACTVMIRQAYASDLAGLLAATRTVCWATSCTGSYYATSCAASIWPTACRRRRCMWRAHERNIVDMADTMALGYPLHRRRQCGLVSAPEVGGLALSTPAPAASRAIAIFPTALQEAGKSL